MHKGNRYPYAVVHGDETRSQQSFPTVPSTMEVAVIRWPEDESRRARARQANKPRLLLVGTHADPPAVADPLEDWVRLPAADGDVRARVMTLEARAAAATRPTVVDGVLRFAGAWVGLSPVEERIAWPLVERFGAVVGRDALIRSAWPADPPKRNALDVHVLRLRRRIDDLGLEIRTVRARGYVLQAALGG